MPDPGEIGTSAAIERYVAGLHVTLRLGIVGLFDLVNLLAIFAGYLRPMMWLSDAAVERFLRRLEGSPIYLVRNAFTGAKALAMLAYYGDPRVEQATGYSDDCLSPPGAKQ
jgi:hypothetical protein